MPSAAVPPLCPSTSKVLKKLEFLARTGQVQRAVLIFRHGEKENVTWNQSLPEEENWRRVVGAPLTLKGRIQARELGRQIADITKVEWLMLLSSNAPRCNATITELAKAAGQDGLPVKAKAAWQTALHKPGEEKLTNAEFKTAGWKSIVDRLARGDRLAGFLSLDQAVQKLRKTCWMHWTCPPSQNKGSLVKPAKPLELTLVCTHDVILYALATWFSGSDVPKTPDFLETALWWQDGGQEHLYFDSQEFVKFVPNSTFINDYDLRC